MVTKQSPGSAAARPLVVVGVDGSASSRRALVRAGWISDAIGGRLQAVTAWHLPIALGIGTAPSDFDPVRDARTLLASTTRAALGDERAAEVELTVTQGGAAAVLLAASEGAEMVVVGSRGHGGFAGLLLGSVSAAVAEHAKVPVLIVHGGPRSGTAPSKVIA